jgi:hypothetical protein
VAAQIRLVLCKAGDNQRIQTGFGQKGGFVIKAGHAGTRVVAAGKGGQRKQPQAHIQMARSCLEQPGELQLGGTQGGIGHVVEQADLNRGGAITTAQQELLGTAHRVTVPRALETNSNANIPSYMAAHESQQGSHGTGRWINKISAQYYSCAPISVNAGMRSADKSSAVPFWNRNWPDCAREQHASLCVMRYVRRRNP